MNASNRTQRLQETIENLVSGTPDITGCAVVTDDGLLIGSVLPADTDEESVGGMAAVLLSLGTRVTYELDLGDVEQMLIRGSKANTLMVECGEGALLIVLMTRRAKLGLVFIDVRRAAKTLSELI